MSVVFISFATIDEVLIKMIGVGSPPPSSSTPPSSACCSHRP
jgi:hypothetical protein